MSDLISRQAAINEKVYSEECHGYVVSVAKLEWLPSAELKGKWLPFWKCSMCKKQFEVATKYCPNCGADMRGEG